MSSIKKSFRTEGNFQVFKNGYRVNVDLVRFVCLALLLYNSFAVYTILTNDRFYLVNDGDAPALNPVYGLDYDIIPDFLESMEYLPPHSEYGKKHSIFVSDATIFTLIILAAFIFINHLLFNDDRESYVWGD